MIDADAARSVSDVRALEVSFSPPLFEQRRMWVLNTLRRERVTSVLDIGCGEGELLRCLCNPAPWLSDPPPPELRSSAAIPVPAPTILPLHMTHLAGLDVSSDDLAYAIRDTEPDPEPELDAPAPELWAPRPPMRWDDLQIKIWKGGLETVNPDLVGYECIVATEVIEHLPPDVLHSFAPVLLGTYRPRLLLVTTPNYTFNARFHPPGTPATRVTGVPDPTRRTDRVFRHPDHKFEWTAEEFLAWAVAAAAQWGYAVNVSGVGHTREPDQWGRDAALGFASQVALFRRLDDEDSLPTPVSGKGQDDEDGMEVDEESASAGLRTDAAHELLITHNYPAHHQTRDPAPLERIGELVEAKMREQGESSARVEELWYQREISAACGGWYELLLDGISERDSLALTTENPQLRHEWTVQVIGGVAPKTYLGVPEPPDRGVWGLDGAEARTEADWGSEEENDRDDLETEWGTGWGDATSTSEAEDSWKEAESWKFEEREVDATDEERAGWGSRGSPAPAWGSTET